MHSIRGFSTRRWKRPPAVDSAPGLCERVMPLRASGCLLLAALLAGCTTSAKAPVANLCPETPRGIPVDPDGCPLYSDADAVPDYLDACPGTAPGVMVDANGCPRDDDGDGIAEGVDACPGTPAGARVDSRGCSLPGEPIAIVTNINFDFNRSNVREDVKSRLGRVIELLKEMPEIDVVIVGYTDDVGTEQYNLALSLRRAESVRDYVVAHGVEERRLDVAGRGMGGPIVSNSTPQGRAVNRRVEFVVR